jgi:hypothetical protein
VPAQIPVCHLAHEARREENTSERENKRRRDGTSIFLRILRILLKFGSFLRAFGFLIKNMTGMRFFVGPVALEASADSQKRAAGS